MPYLIFMTAQVLPFKIIVLGPPVSGKGTQAELLAATFDIPHVAAGQMLHALEKDTTNPDAELIKENIAAGQLVPDGVVDHLILERIKKADCAQGYVLDGYPRTIAQVQTLAAQENIVYVFMINVGDEIIIERASGRRVCANGHSWHIKYAPTRVDNVCDHCGEMLKTRPDDQPDIVSQRLTRYHQEMDPILAWYREQGLLLDINGEQAIEKIFQDMVRRLVVDLRKKLVDG